MWDMSLKSPKQFIKRLGVKLTLWSTCFFIAASLTLYGFTYLRLASTLEAEDMARIHSGLKRYALSCETDTLQRTISKMKGEKRFFFRLADPANHTLYIQVPGEYRGNIDLNELMYARHFTDKKPFKIYKKYNDNYIDIFSEKFADGSILQVGLGNETRDNRLDEFWEAFAFILFPMAFIGLIGGLLITNRLLVPLRTLINTVGKIGDGHMDSRVPVTGSGDELDELAIQFNGMLEKIERLITGMEEALDNVAHDLRTPLTRVRAAVEDVFAGETDEAKVREVLLDCAEESEKIMTMLNTLMDISEARSGAITLHYENTDMEELIDEIGNLYRYVAETRDITIATRVTKDLKAYLDPNRIRQAVANLVDNAVKYTRRNGAIEITAASIDGKYTISVKDDGIGIDAYDLPKIFDRLYRGDKSRSEKGLGLGLSLVQAVVAAHSGEVRVETVLNKGSVFTIILPKST